MDYMTESQSLIAELEQAETMTLEWIVVLKLAAQRRKQVIIEYKYLDEYSKTSRDVEPIKWESGRKGLHVLAQTEDGWRRFALKNILNIQLTTNDYKTKYQVVIN